MKNREINMKNREINMKNREIKETIYKNVYQNPSDGYVLTPSELAFEMISTLPNEVFKSHSTTFLDPICKSGTFLFEIAEKLYNEGHSIGNIEKRIYTIDSNSHSLNIANSYIKRILNKESGSFRVDFKSDFSESFFNYAVGVVSGGRFKTFSEFINTILIDKKYNYLMVELKRNISEFIERYEKVSKLESKLFGEVFTPRQLIDEMLDTLPAEVWKNKDLKWLDPAVGIGNFPAAILDRLMIGLEDSIPNEDERRKWILEEMLYMCDISIKNLFLLYKLFDENNEFKLNVYRGSFLEEDFDKHMKEVWGLEGFDVVVGNPPYQDSSKGNTSVSLWIPFFNKSISIFKNYILYITPINWLNLEMSKYSEFKKYNFEIVNIFSKKNTPFPNIGIDVGYYLVNKMKKFNNETKLNKSKIINLSKYGNLPKNIFEESSLSIWEKVMLLENKMSINRKNQIHTQRKSIWSPEKKGEYIHRTVGSTNTTKEIYSKEIKSNFHSIKVLIPESKSHKKSFIDKDCNTTQGIYYKSVNSYKEGESLLNIINSNLFDYLIKVSKWSPALPQSTLENFPMVDLSKSWTDEELYEHFNLTQEEIDLIEKTIKD